MHRVLEVALQPWPTLVGMKALTSYRTKCTVSDAYFWSDQFCCYDRDNIETRKHDRQQAVDRARGSFEGQVVPVSSMYQRPQPRTLAQLDPDLVTGSSGLLSRLSFYLASK